MVQSSFSRLCICSLFHCTYKLFISVLPNSGRAKQVGADRLWHINWNAPDKLVELRQNATTFGDGITQYDVIGYVIEATEAGRGANVQQTQRAIVQNTTNDLNALFPVFKNQFANVSFKVSFQEHS